MISSEGDTRACLLYAHVRLCSVERNASSSVTLPAQSFDVNVNILSEAKARKIVFLLATYLEVARNTLKTHEPSVIISYCFRCVRFRRSMMSSGLTNAQASTRHFLCLGNSHRHEPGTRVGKGSSDVVHMRSRCFGKCNATSITDTSDTNMIISQAGRPRYKLCYHHNHRHRQPISIKYII